MRRMRAGIVLLLGGIVTMANAEPMTLTMRRQAETEPGSGRYTAVEEKARWEAKQTALIVCDMWDKHWCAGATARVGELAPVMNRVLLAARKRGVFIVHAPSDTMEFYRDAPQRLKAQNAPKVPLPTLKTLPTEPPLPIDDSDGGCDSAEKPWYKAWTRQHPDLKIAPEDAISDNGDEVYSLLKARGIENVILMGVHTNMCVLGRPFAIRRMVALGLNVALMRDMTDTMYNPKMPPHVSHFRGTELVVEHIEKHLCPSLTSADFTGKPSFRFKGDKTP